MTTYTPQVGDVVAARRKKKIDGQPNLIVGPVVELQSEVCRIITNPCTDLEGDFQLELNDWKFQFLHKVQTE